MYKIKSAVCTATFLKKKKIESMWMTARERKQHIYIERDYYTLLGNGINLD